MCLQGRVAATVFGGALGCLLACSLAPGPKCTQDVDCEQGVRCTAGKCVAVATCLDGAKSDSETDVDCGGDCPKCATGLACSLGSDCMSGSCDANACQAAAWCDDGSKSGDETDGDCGGSCPGCTEGKACRRGSDCGAGLGCREGLCTGGCSIGGSFVPPDAVNPGNACERCDPTTSAIAWTRQADGTRCASSSCGAWGDCGGFADSCGNAGTQSRSCTVYACSAGACTASAGSESQSCSRDTDGVPCGVTTCGDWGACEGFPDVCATTGSQTLECTSFACSGGACSEGRRIVSRGCLRDTNGDPCASTTCGPWSDCSWSSCAADGSRYRACTDFSCGSGSCRQSGRTETVTCTRSVQCTSGSLSCVLTLSQGQLGCTCANGCTCNGEQTCDGTSCTWTACQPATVLLCTCR